jgi:hypothetical protein
MPFGKHKGQRIEDIPTSYLAWLLNECDLERWLEHAVTEEMERRREAREERRAQQQADYPPPADLAGLIARCHRELTMAHHPDRGGDVDVMKGVNLTIDRLKQLAGV